jgi:predicted RNase H-like HicB family nuclease
MADLSVITYSGEDGYIVAECLEIPGCLSQGKTKEEALHSDQSS